MDCFLIDYFTYGHILQWMNKQCSLSTCGCESVAGWVSANLMSGKIFSNVQIYKTHRGKLKTGNCNSVSINRSCYKKMPEVIALVFKNCSVKCKGLIVNKG